MKVEIEINNADDALQALRQMEALALVYGVSRTTLNPAPVNIVRDNKEISYVLLVKKVFKETGLSLGESKRLVDKFRNNAR